MSDTTNVNQSMGYRRAAKDQERNLDQAASAINSLMRPYLEIWATMFTVAGGNLTAAGNMISSSIEGWNQQH